MTRTKPTDWFYVKVCRRAARDAVRSAATPQGIVSGAVVGIASLAMTYLLTEAPKRSDLGIGTAMVGAGVVVGSWITGVLLFNLGLAPPRIYREEAQAHAELRAASDQRGNKVESARRVANLFHRGQLLQIRTVNSAVELDRWKADLERWQNETVQELSAGESATFLHMAGMKGTLPSGFNMDHRVDRGALEHMLNNLYKVVERREARAAG